MRRPIISVSLFPFLSVLLSTMGVLSFLAVTFLLFTEREQAVTVEQPVEVRWIGAPAHVRPLLVECRATRVVLHGAEGRITFSRERIDQETERVKALQERALRMLGSTAGREQLWLFFKTVLAREDALADSFTLALHAMELDNLQGRAKAAHIEHYPILLVYPRGITTCDRVSYLAETTTRLHLGLEPMLDGWELPYRESAF